MTLYYKTKEWLYQQSIPGLFYGTTPYTENLSGQWDALPGPAPAPSEVHPEYCLLVWSLAGRPQSELAQQVEVLLLLADLELKHANDTFVPQPLCSLANQHDY
jgi:hypothetical protein